MSFLIKIQSFDHKLYKNVHLTNGAEQLLQILNKFLKQV